MHLIYNYNIFYQKLLLKSFPSLRRNVDVVDKGELKLKEQAKIELKNDGLHNIQAPHRPYGALPRKAGKDLEE